MADAGGLCVTMLGTSETLLWPAGSWAAGVPWPPQGVPSLERGLAPSSWMISGVGEMRQPCDSALRGPGVSMTVTIGRMPGPCVTVRAYSMSDPSGEGWGSACIVTGVDGKEVVSQLSLHFLCDFPFSILYSYSKPYAKLTKGSLVSL